MTDTRTDLWRWAARAATVLALVALASCGDDGTGGDDGGGPSSLDGSFPTSDRCSAPTHLDLDEDGRVTVSGTTAELTDEFPKLSCGTKITLDAPQAYYSFDAKANKIYRIELTPIGFSAYLYVFTKATSCTADAVQKACSSRGASGDTLDRAILPGSSRALYVAPKRSGRYVVAVDSLVSSYGGRFGLTISESDPPDNTTCKDPKDLKLKGGKATVSGDTGPSKDEFSKLSCGGHHPLSGRQLYYRFLANADRAYRFTVEPQFWGQLYLFSSNAACKSAAVESDCASGGKRGMAISMGPPGVTRSFTFQPEAVGDYLFAADSIYGDAYGRFRIDVEEFTPLAHGRCTKAKRLSLGSKGKAVVDATTAGAGTDEWPTLSCGGIGHYSGPQLYYSFEVETAKEYRLTLAPGFDAELYVFSDSADCKLLEVEKACASLGSTGDRLVSTVAAGTTKTLRFRPKTNGTYVVAVDGSAPYRQGRFRLTVEAHQRSKPPANAKCTGAKAVTLSGGKATIKESTSSSVDEFPTLSCGSPARFTGRQLYYTIHTRASKAYRLHFTPKFWSYLYAFPKSSGCSAAAIDNACATRTSGVFSSLVGSGSQRTLLLSPSTPGDYVIGVDSGYPGDHGDFTLEVNEIDKPVEPTNDTCKAPKTLSLTSGSATIKGDTSAAVDDLSMVTCGLFVALRGPQVYYALTPPSSGLAYRLTLTSSFPAYLYTFDGATQCSTQDVSTACASNGKHGDSFLSASTATVPRSLYVKPSGAGPYIIAVDSYSTTMFGPFTLKVDRFTPATNATCSTASRISLTSGKATVSGNTALVKDEFSALTCGGQAPLQAPQVYYRFTAKSGKKYELKLVSDHFANLVVFSQSARCSDAKVEASCASKGASGMLSAVVSPGKKGSTATFRPALGGDYIVAVDGLFADDFGAFTLEITEL